MAPDHGEWPSTRWRLTAPESYVLQIARPLHRREFTRSFAGYVNDHVYPSLAARGLMEVEESRRLGKNVLLYGEAGVGGPEGIPDDFDLGGFDGIDGGFDGIDAGFDAGGAWSGDGGGGGGDGGGGGG